MLDATADQISSSKSLCGAFGDDGIAVDWLRLLFTIVKNRGVVGQEVVTVSWYSGLETVGLFFFIRFFT